MGIWEKENVGEYFFNVDGMFEGKSILGIFSGKTGPYVSVFESGFYQKIPGTTMWKPMHKNLPEKTIYNIIESRNGELIVCTRNGIYKTPDEGKSWQQLLKDKWLFNLVVKDSVFIVSSSKGLIRSTDFGETWNCVLEDKDAVYNTIVTENGFTAMRIGGPLNSKQEPIRLRESQDGGLTWKITTLDSTLTKTLFDYDQSGSFTYCSTNKGVSRALKNGKIWELVLPMNPIREPYRYRLFINGNNLFAVKVFSGC